jgi:hypothetical protein
MANLEGFKKSFDKRMSRSFGEKFTALEPTAKKILQSRA